MTEIEAAEGAGQEAAPATEAPKPRAWTICLIDESAAAKVPGQLVGYESVTAIEPPARAPGRYTARNGCDLPLMRYRLVKASNGRERFEQIVHAMDDGEENVKPDIRIVPILARIVAGCQRPGDTDALAEYLRTFDGAE